MWDHPEKSKDGLYCCWGGSEEFAENGEGNEGDCRRAEIKCWGNYVKE